MEYSIGNVVFRLRGLSLSQIHFLLLLLLSNYKLTGVAAQRKAVSFIFGDSLSDVGNNNYLSSALAKANLPWYGIDYGNGMPTGRFTNGRTISDIVAEKMGLPIPPACLSPSTDADAVLQNGVNYASGGGGILNETGWHFIDRLSLSKQIELFEGTKAAVTQKLGREGADNFFRESLYLIAMGSNDYINNYLLTVNADAWQYSPPQFADYLMSTLRQQLTNLHRLGAQKVLFFGLGPLGCIPLQRVLNSDGSCREDLNLWATQFNDAARNLMEELNSRLAGARFNFADGYSAIYRLIQNPRAYGFDVSDTPCCMIGSYFPTLTCLPAANLCPDRSKYVFWDEYHPTEAANLILANSLLSDPNLQRDLNSTRFPTPAPAPAPAPAPSPSPSSQ